ncbi:hypothetical protein COT42_07055 [Candidatus Saganbacteria bacterium CG08_land_8_20_14_0_20_45_16]|uniref:C_GCAxxG_C_C family protein n=1 Tax=Candidatus Saganbacteria bacterium CG08_land_8_20_14_0_20_45_16 TaxID=2014293 RepID=A0A2H0XUX0_UNCSA|nr:MAG: hypothetical protein COT42_07055 [Candidatus Saganbacteria bacterium CG08_land_8_20_14_0_20_45_16]
MKVKKALSNFIGRNGAKRLNCAQSVAAVYLEDGLLSEEEFAALAGSGYGRAPEGCCGSAYAARCILQKFGVEKVAQFDRAFIAYAKSLACKEIRSLGQIKCFQTVKKATELVELLLRKAQ